MSDWENAPAPDWEDAPSTPGFGTQMLDFGKDTAAMVTGAAGHLMDTGVRLGQALGGETPTPYGAPGSYQDVLTKPFQHAPHPEGPLDPKEQIRREGQQKFQNSAPVQAIKRAADTPLINTAAEAGGAALQDVGTLLGTAGGIESAGSALARTPGEVFRPSSIYTHGDTPFYDEGAASSAVPGPLTRDDFAPAKPRITPKAGESAQAAAARQGVTTPAAPGAPPAAAAAPEPPVAPTAAPAAVRAPSAAPDRRGAPPPDVHHPDFFDAPDNPDLKSGPASEQEQAARLAAVERGAPTLPQVRDSAITNDYATQGRDWTGKQAADPVATAQIAAEGQALHSEAGRISAETGGQLGTGESASTIRGRAYQDWHDTTVDALDRHITKAYADEDETAKLIHSKGENLKGVLGDDSLIDSQDAAKVRDSLKSLAKKMGVDLDDPNATLNAYQLEALRKHANAVYKNGPRFAQGVKNAVDADLPPGAYVRGRALRQLKGDMFDNRDGINQLGPSTDINPATKLPRPENRPVKAPEVMNKIENMDPGQVDHIMRTMKRSSSVLKSLGDDKAAETITDKALKAAQAVQSHFTERWIDEASKGGGWNTRRAHQFLRANQETLANTMSPEQLHQMRNVNSAANVLDMDKRYKGAFAQFTTGAGWLRQRFGRVAEGIMSDLVPPGMNTVGELTGISEAIRNRIGGKGVANAPENFTRPLGQTAKGASQRGGPKIDLQQGASGESSASPEAQNRVRQETAAGQHRYQIDPDGNVTPLRGVDAVDAKAPAGHVIVQRGTGFQPYAVLDRGGLPSTQANGLLARAQGLGKLAEAERAQAPLGQTLFGGKQLGAVGWHGTPHTFEPAPDNPLGKFDPNKIGSGEGAQAYGHGIYVAENPDVAGTYRYAGSGINPDTTKYKGMKIETLYNRATHAQDIANHGSDRAAINRANAEAYFWESMMTRSHPDRVIANAVDPNTGWPELKQFAQSLDRSKFNVPKTGNLYNVDVPDKHVAKMLDWDKPLNEQPPHVQQGLRTVMPTHGASMERQGHMTGGEFYNYIAGGRGQDAPKVSNAMRNAGIPGIKYFDEGSRAAGQGTRNFVLFDPSIAKIIGKNDEQPLGQTLFGGKQRGAVGNLNRPAQNKEPPATINVGLHVGDPANGGRVMTPAEVLAGIKAAGGKVGRTSIVQSDTEPTLVADLAKPFDKRTLGGLSKNLQQDAIAQRHADGTGILAGPKAAEWGGKYNPDFFRMHSGQTATESQPVLSNLTDEERAQLRSHTTQRLMDAFAKAPATEEYAAAALAGAAKRGWYANSARTIGNVFGPDAPRFSALLAAMSPQTSVEGNFHNALRTFINWDSAGRPHDPEAIKSIMRGSVQRQENGIGVLPAWENNSIRALTADDPGNVKLSGPKVHSFYSNLHDKVNEVTNDAWMATFSKFNPLKLGGSLNQSGPGKTPSYLALSARVRGAAKMLSNMTGEAWTPREVQETVWSWAKTAFEHSLSSGTEKTIPELVKQGHITDDLIRSTPDFHQLFSTPEHRGFLEGSRYAANAADVARGQGEGALPAGTVKARAAAAKTLRPHLLSAADRLEAVRQERLAEVPF